MRISPFSFSTICFALLATACDDPAPQVLEKPILEKVEVPNRNERLDVPARERLLSQGQLDALRQAEEAGPASVREMVTFTLPTGWVEVSPARFRDVNLKAGPAGEIECYLTFLDGGGGGAKPNIDRWRMQFGMDPSTDAEFAALTKTKLFGRDAVRVELIGQLTAMNQPAKPDQTMLGIFAEFPAFAMSLKMVGPSALVAAEKTRFDELTASFRFKDLPDEGTASSAPTATAPSESSAAKTGAPAGPFDPTKVKWATPSGWTTGTGSSMRLVTYDVPGGGQIWVTPLSGAAGGVRANLDRFRKEMGAEPLSDDEFAALPKLRILGVESPWLDLQGSYAGMGGPTNLPAGSARMLVAVCALEDALVTVKFVGPGEVLGREISNFQAFCESLEVGK